MVIKQSYEDSQHNLSGAHRQETATTPYSCHRVFTDRSIFSLNLSRIDHFTVVCLVAWPLNGSEAGGDLVLHTDLTAVVV